MSAPTRFTIQPDDYHARFVGTTGDGLRFFITTPYEAPTSIDPGTEFVAMFLWNADGSFHSVDIDSFGPRETIHEMDRQDALERLFARTGEAVIEPISVEPFAVQSHGTTFGFVPFASGDVASVTLQPGDYMTYTSPWDGESYAT